MSININQNITTVCFRRDFAPFACRLCFSQYFGQIFAFVLAGVVFWKHGKSVFAIKDNNSVLFYFVFSNILLHIFAFKLVFLSF